jgi:hypothetical protein
MRGIRDLLTAMPLHFLSPQIASVVAAIAPTVGHCSAFAVPEWQPIDFFPSSG